MRVSLESAFKAGMGVFDEDDDDEGGLTELEKFSPTRVDGVADPASGFPILLLKSLGAAPASRPAISRPLPDLGEAWRAERAQAKALRKAAKTRSVAQQAAREALDRQVDRVLAELVVEQTAALRARVADARERIEWLEKQRGIVRDNNDAEGRRHIAKSAGMSVDEVAEALGQARKRAAAGGVVSKRRCGACGKNSKSLMPTQNFCSRCGHGLNGQGAAKASGTGPARSRCSACGLLDKAGADRCGRCDRRLPPASPAESDEVDKSYQCPGCESAVHADRDSCAFCGQVRPAAKKSAGPGFEALSLDEKQRLLRTVRKATESADPDVRLAGIGELVAKLGPQVAVKVLEGAPLSPAEFTRAFLANGRAPLSAPAGQTPRIPDMSHVISGDDFRRPALESGHQRPNPLSPLERLQQAGQMGVYPPGAGVPAGDRYATSPTSSTLAPALARSLSMFANAPMPGDARG